MSDTVMVSISAQVTHVNQKRHIIVRFFESVCDIYMVLRP